MQCRNVVWTYDDFLSACSRNTDGDSTATCVRGAGSHGDVLNVHTGVF